MEARELINPRITPLHPSDKVSQIQRLMERSETSVLPVVDGLTFKGMVTNQILNTTKPSDWTVSQLPLEKTSCVVYSVQHFLEAVRTIDQHNSPLVAVIDPNAHYQGAIVREDLITAVGQTLQINSKGAILVISTHKTDRLLSEVARIIESKGTEILYSSITGRTVGTGLSELTVKINKENSAELVPLLESEGYLVTAIFGEVISDGYHKERIDNFFSFLNT